MPPVLAELSDHEGQRQLNEHGPVPRPKRSPRRHGQPGGAGQQETFDRRLEDRRRQQRRENDVRDVGGDIPLRPSPEIGVRLHPLHDEEKQTRRGGDRQHGPTRRPAPGQKSQARRQRGRQRERDDRPGDQPPQAGQRGRFVGRGDVGHGSGRRGRCAAGKRAGGNRWGPRAGESRAALATFDRRLRAGAACSNLRLRPQQGAVWPGQSVTNATAATTAAPRANRTGVLRRRALFAPLSDCSDCVAPQRRAGLKNGGLGNDRRSGNPMNPQGGRQQSSYQSPASGRLPTAFSRDSLVVRTLTPRAHINPKIASPTAPSPRQHEPIAIRPCSISGGRLAVRRRSDLGRLAPPRRRRDFNRGFAGAAAGPPKRRRDRRRS